MISMLTFVVTAAPEWAETINNTQIDIGSEHTMRCVATGKPFPFIRWYKDGYMVKISHNLSPDSRRNFNLHWLCVFPRMEKVSCSFPA